jgi:hypothetical protein
MSTFRVVREYRYKCGCGCGYTYTIDDRAKALKDAADASEIEVVFGVHEGGVVVADCYSKEDAKRVMKALEATP